MNWEMTEKETDCVAAISNLTRACQAGTGLTGRRPYISFLRAICLALETDGDTRPSDAIRREIKDHEELIARLETDLARRQTNE